MDRRTFLAGLPLALSHSALAAPDAARPNIVFILADDLGYGDLSCYNRESKIPTPNLDALAARGVRFSDAHTPSAVCTPTRYGLLTGRYAWRTRLDKGVLDGFDPPLIEPNRVTLASMLKGAGYTTACIGKWHLGMEWTRRDGSKVPFRPSFAGGFRDGRDVDYSKDLGGGPLSAGFDSYFGIAASLDMSPYCFLENRRVVSYPRIETPAQKDLFLNQVAGVTSAGFDLHNVLPECGKRARQFIDSQRGAKNPFFLYLPLTGPHLPIVPTKEFIGKSKAGQYGDFVAEVDSIAGSVLDRLKANGMDRNTLVFFTSDNGSLWQWWKFQEADDVNYGRITPRSQYMKDFGHQSNGPLRGTKADLWEGGHRVPFIVSWPDRISRPRVDDALICLTDVITSVAELCGIRLPSDCAEDSISMAGHLLGASPAGKGREDVVFHSVQGEFAIQKANWKLIVKRGSGGFSVPKTVPVKDGEPAGQLYDVTADPQETRNVYLKHPGVVQSLTGLLQRYKQSGRSRPI